MSNSSDPMDYSPPGSSVPGISQARIPFVGDLANPWIEPMFPALQVVSLLLCQIQYFQNKQVKVKIFVIFAYFLYYLTLCCFFFWISHYLEARGKPNLSPITNNRNLSSFAHCIWVSASVRKHHIAEPGMNQCLTHAEKRQRKICFGPGHSSVKADETLLAAVTGQLAFTHPSCAIAGRTSSPPWRRQNGEVGQVQMMYTLKQNQGTHSEFETDNRPSTGCGDSISQ